MTPTEIKANRAAFGLAQWELGEMLRVSQHTISMWEQGKSYPRGTKMQELEELFGLQAKNILEATPAEQIIIAERKQPETKKNESILQNALSAIVFLQSNFMKRGQLAEYRKLQEAIDNIMEVMEMENGI